MEGRERTCGYSIPSGCGSTELAALTSPTHGFAVNYPLLGVFWLGPMLCVVESREVLWISSKNCANPRVVLFCWKVGVEGALIKGED